MQAPGGPEEDPTGGFAFGGWVAPFADVDPVFGEEVGRLFGEPFDLLLGRRTYDIFAAYWPYAEGGSYALRDAATDVARLKQEDGPALVTQGSTELVNSLLAAGPVDEIRTFTFPVLLGRGKRLFDETSEPRAFQLTHSAVSPNGFIAATFVRGGEVKTATIGGAQEPTPAELARREKLKREG